MACNPIALENLKLQIPDDTSSKFILEQGMKTLTGSNV
jgi:hypothetical protein